MTAQLHDVHELQGLFALTGVRAEGDGPGLELPCHRVDPDAFFAEAPADIEHAKSLCRGCPLLAQCLEGALARREPWGVWGGELFIAGQIVARKRPRGRPRKDAGFEVAA